MPDSDGGAAAGHPYKDRMDPETAARFDRMSAEPDMAYEIKLVRTFIAALTGDLIRNGRLMMQAMAVLMRAVQIRLKQAAGQTDVERFLHEIGDRVLTDLEQRDE